jgi:protein SCO1
LSSSSSCLPVRQLSLKKRHRHLPISRRSSALGLAFLSPEGKITRYLNGIVYLPFDLEMGILEASKGMVGSPVKRMLLLCHAYDPGSRKYELGITKIAGLATLFFIALYILIFLLRGGLKKKHEAAMEAPQK